MHESRYVIVSEYATGGTDYFRQNIPIYCIQLKLKFRTLQFLITSLITENESKHLLHKGFFVANQEGARNSTINYAS